MEEPRWLTSEELHAWRWMAALMLILPGKLEEALSPFGLTFFDYSILAGLSDAPDHTLRMSDVAMIANGSLSRLSHAAKRLEKRGWLERHASPDDRRVTLATLTDAGRRHLVEVAPHHVASVRQAVFDVLPPDQVGALDAICSAIVRNVSPVLPPWDRGTS